MADVVTQSLTKRFGKTAAVDQVSLACRDGEFFVLLSPSGAGKTTTLKALGRLPSARVRLGVRPADITVAGPDESRDGPALPSQVLVVEPSERSPGITLSSGGIEFRVKTPAGGVVRAGDAVQARFDPSKLHAFDPATGLALGQDRPTANKEARNGTGAH